MPVPASSDDLFMKIHAIFAQLGFAAAAAHVDLPDQATLCAAEQYFALQQGLVWRNMAAKFAAEGLDPTGEDEARIKAGIERAAEISQCVAEKQQQLLQQHADQLMQAELDFVRYVCKSPLSLPHSHSIVQSGFMSSLITACMYVWPLDRPNVMCISVSLHFMLYEKTLTCRAKRSQDERDAEARRYHKDTSTLSVKVPSVKHVSSH